MGTLIDFILENLDVDRTCDELTDIYLSEFPKDDRVRVHKKIRNKLYVLREQDYVDKYGPWGNTYWKLVKEEAEQCQ